MMLFFMINSLHEEEKKHIIYTMNDMKQEYYTAV